MVSIICTWMQIDESDYILHIIPAANSNSKPREIKISDLIIIQSLFQCLSPKEIGNRRYQSEIQDCFHNPTTSIHP